LRTGGELLEVVSGQVLVLHHLKRCTTWRTRVAGFRMIVRPTVFHPRYFLTSEFFA
jgi:hypothetical protein